MGYKKRIKTLKQDVQYLRRRTALLQHGDVYEDGCCCIRAAAEEICEAATSLLKRKSWLQVGFVHDAIWVLRREIGKGREYKHVAGGFAAEVYYYEKQYIFKIISSAVFIAITVLDIMERDALRQPGEFPPIQPNWAIIQPNRSDVQPNRSDSTERGLI